MLAAAPTEKKPLTTAPSIDIHVTYSYMLGLYTTLSRLVLVFRQLYASAGGNFCLPPLAPNDSVGMREFLSVILGFVGCHCQHLIPFWQPLLIAHILP